MEMELYRVPCAVGQASSAVRNALAVMPSAQSKEEKVVVGDKSGAVTCWRLTNPKEAQVVFKTPPESREVTAMALGGPRVHKDKIFVAFGHTIAGVKKNGKEFFRFNTTLNEDIRHMFVDNVTIWTSGEYILNRFENCIDTGFYMCNDIINHFTIEFDTMGSTADLYAILACQDSYLRVVNGSELLSELIVCAPVTSIMSYPTPGSYAASERGTTTVDVPGSTAYIGFRRIIFGTARGQIGHVLMGPGGKLVKQDFVVDTEAGAVTCMAHADLNGSGFDDIIVGHECGTVSVYSWENSSNGSTLFHAYTTVFQESISSCSFGHIISMAKMEVIIVTYSGTVTILRHDPPKDECAKAGERRINALKKSTSNVASTLNLLLSNSPAPGTDLEQVRQQLEAVTRDLNARRTLYQQKSAELVAVETQFHVNHSCRLDPALAAYILTIEIEMPIDVIALSSNVMVLILNSSAIASTSPGDADTPLLCTFRSAETSNRMTVQLRTLEGRSGDLKICIVPKLYPKTAQMLTIPIKPLSLHEKVPSMPPSTLPLNSITFTGMFSLAQIHSWIALCLPDVSGHISQSEGKLVYTNVFLGTQLQCQYKKGEAIFTSDSGSTISIIREVISKEATSCKVQFTMKLDLSPSSIMSLVDRIRPKVECHTCIANKHDKIAALKEILTQEGDACLEFLSPDYVDILKNADAIQRELELAPRHIDFLRVMLTDLFRDVHRLSGRSAQQRLPELEHILKEFNYDQVTALFKTIAQ